jgi:hypothetical protein
MVSMYLQNTEGIMKADEIMSIFEVSAADFTSDSNTITGRLNYIQVT